MHKLISLRVFVLLRLPTASCSCHLVATSFLLIPVHPSHTLTNTHAPHRSSKPASPPSLPHNTKTAPALRALPPRSAAHTSTAGAREPPAPACACAALVEHPRRGGGTVRVAGGAKGGRGRARVEGGGCGKLGELWVLVGALGAAREGQAGGAGRQWKVVDEDWRARIAQILSEQQGDLADIHFVLKGGRRQGEEGDGEELGGSSRGGTRAGPTTSSAPGGYTREYGINLTDEYKNALVAYGTHFIANPDLPLRLRKISRSTRMIGRRFIY
ncbi:hypothetical protein DFH08DRAFT_1079184 [Mycena albidolilacea]|uniref:Uncharacterized protein n=1 Tax=Mycena albidolilacea TaxID=1033008 RepID=A0AAD7ET23_9AGAR|nr:hypothetical protein DFH08DRAFT_1079184 [Mycena albidolilacea]